MFAGIGSSFVYLPSHVLCGLYYKRHQSLATGIATAGSGLGSAIMPFVFAKLIEEYYWRQSLYVAAGLMLNLFVFAALLRPPPPHIHRRKKPKAEGQALLDSGGHKHCNGDGSIALCEDSNGVATSVERQDSDMDDACRAMVTTTSENIPVDSDVDCAEKTPCDSSVDCEKKSAALSPETEADTECKQLSDHETVTEDAGLMGENTFSDTSLKEGHKILRHIYLFTDFGFNMYFLSSILWNACVAAFIAFGPDFTNERGITIMDSALLLAIFGIFNCTGAIVGAVIGNIWRKTRISQYAVACVITGGFIFVFPQGQTFGQFAAILTCAGLFFGVILGLLVVVLVDLIGTVNLSDGMGWVMLANGVGAFSGPVLTGKTRKKE